MERISLDDTGVCLLVAGTLLFGCARPSSSAQEGGGEHQASAAAALPSATATAAANGSVDVEAKSPLARLDGLPPALSKTLAAQAVHQGNWFAQRELFTWMPALQRKGLAGHRRLVSRRSTAKATAVFDWRLAQRRAAFKNPKNSAAVGEKPPVEQIIALLSQGPLRFRRFAWSNPWATARGLAGEAYGDKLVKVTLKDNAWLARFDSRVPAGWQVATLKGEPISLEQLAKEPSRLAAIYHVWHGQQEATEDRSPASLAPFREFILCNESMIHQFEADTETVVRRVQQDQQFIAGLVAHISQHPVAVLPAGAERMRLLDELLWSAVAKPAKPGFFGSGLAAATEPYRLDGEQLMAIATALGASLKDPDAPLLHHVTARYGVPLRPLVKPMMSRRCRDPSMMGPGCP